ncbi:hypothetical protein ECE50_018680 [Chitinophaga sp. Mgbs1]|uniref:Outer membrane protein beta-barrel domain-containing protein n=1 Tax=Chitinophaga solisilvae TaxID=1233460 RepID=A0A9Q5D7A0_9BACT|nr:hypothetical protein [Chitinophaga solisilvae]
MIRILLFSLLSSILTGITVQAQNKPAVIKDTLHKPAADTLRKKGIDTTATAAVKAKDSTYFLPGGIRVGVDLSRIITAIYYPYRKEFTAVADVRLKSDLYGAVEAGYTNTPYSDDNYTYKGSGAFITLGVDYNFMKRLYPSEKNMFYGGIRYGFSHLTYEVPSYKITSPYWGGNLTGSVPKTNVNAHWVELVLGLKAEVLKNFFLGWSLRERILLNNIKTDEFTPLVMPGFGSGSKKSIFDMQYTVSYVFPLYKIKVHVKEKKEKEKKIPKR